MSEHKARMRGLAKGGVKNRQSVLGEVVKVKGERRSMVGIEMQGGKVELGKEKRTEQGRNGGGAVPAAEVGDDNPAVLNVMCKVDGCPRLAEDGVNGVNLRMAESGGIGTAGAGCGRAAPGPGRG